MCYCINRFPTYKILFTFITKITLFDNPISEKGKKNKTKFNLLNLKQADKMLGWSIFIF